VKDVKPAMNKEDQEKEEKKRRKELSAEEKQIIMMSEDFQRFFDRSARLAINHLIK